MMSFMAMMGQMQPQQGAFQQQPQQQQAAMRQPSLHQRLGASTSQLLSSNPTTPRGVGSGALAARGLHVLCQGNCVCEHLYEKPHQNTAISETWGSLQMQPHTCPARSTPLELVQLLIP